MKKPTAYVVNVLIGLLLVFALNVAAPEARSGQAAPAARAMGDVVEIQPGHLTLHTEKGDIRVDLPDSVKVLRSPDMKTLVPATLSDIAPGDRAAVIGHLADDQKTFEAARVVVMKKADLASVHEAEVREWQTRGIEGVVKALDPTKLEITLAVPNHPPTPGNLTHPVTVTTTPQTVFMRYAPNSVQFADATKSDFAGIHQGDQLRALGEKNDDGSQYAAQKVVSGTFHNIGATVISVDPAANMLTVKNLATNKPVVVHATADCRMHELPPSLAQVIARLSSGASGGRPGAGGPPGGGPGGAGPGAAPGAGGPPGGPGGEGPGGEGGGMHRGGMSNLSQALERMPALTLNDIKKGEPIIIFSTEGTSPSDVTAIYILTGVEPILAAQPKGGGEMNLGSWNLSLGGGGGGDTAP